MQSDNKIKITVVNIGLHQLNESVKRSKKNPFTFH